MTGRRTSGIRKTIWGGWPGMAIGGMLLTAGLIVVGSVGAQEPVDGATDPSLLNPSFGQVIANPAPLPAPDQPLPFSHKWHVGDVGLDCANCHTNPDPGRLMTYPDTETCMQCHADIAVDKEPIKKLTYFHNAHQEVPWLRVYTVLPGVNWSHRTHVDAGVGCLNCHGPVPELTQMREMTSVTSMASCMSCHQEQQVRNTCTTCHSWPDDRLIRAGR